MILYHHTSPDCVPSIIEHGLMPHTAKSAEWGLLLHNRPVVWLTRASTCDYTDGDREWFTKNCPNRPLLEHGRWLDRTCIVCLTVNFAVKTNRLAHFATWVRDNSAVVIDEDGFARGNNAGHLQMTDSILAVGLPPSAQHWWVYFGTVSPRRILAPKVENAA